MRNRSHPVLLSIVAVLAIWTPCASTAASETRNPGHIHLVLGGKWLGNDWRDESLGLTPMPVFGICIS